MPTTAGATRPSPAPTSDDREWLALLGKSLTEEHDYAAEAEGDIPPALRGTLYRNGPGLFDRAGYRKRLLLDGDGLIQAFAFGEGEVRYRNRFVRTAKFVAEEAAGRFIHPTWSTRAPGGVLNNLGGGHILSQAGVTVVARDGRLFAFDEVGAPWEVDPATLETRGEHLPDGRESRYAYKAHTKIDAATGDWILMKVIQGRRLRLEPIVLGPDGTVKSRRRLTSPRNVYIHDFFATENHVIVPLHPVYFSPLPFVAGVKSFSDCLVWRPQRGNMILVVPKDPAGQPVILNAPPAFLWHTVNAYERGTEIVADFVGYDNPDHFIGPDPEFKAIMTGRPGRTNCSGTVRRYVIDVGARSLRQEIIDGGNHELPMVNPWLACRRYRLGYFHTGDAGSMFPDGIARLDLATGKRDAFSFGGTAVVGEPVFAPKPGAEHSGDAKSESGWLLSQGLHAKSGLSFLAIFDAAHVAGGPVAKIWLRHHTPINFHGVWCPA